MTATTRALRPLLVLALLLLSACGGGDSSSDSGQASEGAADQSAESTPMGTASVTGSVMFDGTPPEMPRIRLDPECQELHDGPVTARTVVVGEGGGLANVFVRVSEGLPDGYSYAPSSEPAVLDQEGCMYHPHVMGVQADQDIQVLNSDPFLHNINAQPDVNRGFNFGMPNQGDERTRSFRVVEVAVPIKCDVHPWMNAYIAVVDHPYFAVSGEDGSFTIDQLPAGTYTIEAWHEEYGTSTQTVTVADGESAATQFTFSADSAS